MENCLIKVILHILLVFFYKIIPIKVLTFLLVCIIINSTRRSRKEKADVNRKVCEQENRYCGAV